MPQWRTVRKAIEAGAGVVLIGVLEYITESTDLARWLEQLVPAPLVPIVPVLLGGIALTVRVYRAPYVPASVASDTVVQPAPGTPEPPVPVPAPAAPAVTPPGDQDAPTEAVGATGAPVQLLLRDPAAAAAVARSLEPAPVELEPAPEPAAPPTSFIPLPTTL